MNEHQRKTVRLLVETGALRFGDFELKSGRRSPYFINLGDISDGRALSELGSILAAKIVADIGVDTFDVLFGPAYKGIVLASAAASALFSEHGITKAFCFDRKEAKAHGEGGTLIGCDLNGEQRRVLIVDDVITDGKTKIETIEKITAETKAVVTGILAVVDRMEKNKDGDLFSGVIAGATGVPVQSVVTLADIVEYIGEAGRHSLGIDGEAFKEMLSLARGMK